MKEEELINGCLNHNRNSQKVLFESYSEHMMNVCFRYAKNKEEAKKILLTGFNSTFNNLKELVELNQKRKKDSPVISLEDWVKKQMILAAIDHLHNNKKEYFVSSTVVAKPGKVAEEEINDEHIIQSASQDNIISALQQLSPSYRVIYNLHELDNYSHKEIAQMLDISEYASKDSLTKAQFTLRKNLVNIISKTIHREASAKK